MGLMDTIKGWFGGNKDSGEDRASTRAPTRSRTRFPTNTTARSTKGAEAAKDAVDKID